MDVPYRDPVVLPLDGSFVSSHQDLIVVFYDDRCAPVTSEWIRVVDALGTVVREDRLLSRVGWWEQDLGVLPAGTYEIQQDTAQGWAVTSTFTVDDSRAVPLEAPPRRDAYEVQAVGDPSEPSLTFSLYVSDVPPGTRWRGIAGRHVVTEGFAPDPDNDALRTNAMLWQEPLVVHSKEDLEETLSLQVELIDGAGRVVRVPDLMRAEYSEVR